MKFLSIDTSTKYSVLAIFDEERLGFGERRLFEKGRVDGLDILIREGLKKTRARIERIGCFGAGVGPGSFTGLRVGLSSVKGLGYGLAVPVAGFSSLDAIAYNFLEDEAVVDLCVMVDARRANVYCRFYKRRKDGFVHISADELVPAKGLFSRCKPSTVFCGDAVGLYRHEIEKEFGIRAISPEAAWFPTPESIRRLSLEAFASGRTKSCYDLSARYLYEQDCQVKKAC
ncbi:MAG TPA: tRNA (adenosine(37)-N6)-threonylcarbamoyltransferase complex dimerization subunit type 1 TsaB [Candidatus Omnitrophica bacterium]|nr:tRNA (adenosine(37)-N6)-threonylcarbamoyltransferase complex dimerization subunit type 1 TsaB [Candidatus Omnitrophota bacterium]